MTIPYLRLSAFYFFYFATVGGFIPYWSLYLEDHGFNAIEIGQLSAFMMGTKIIAPNVWGWIADHTGKSLPIVRVATVFSAIFFISFLFIHHYNAFFWATILFSFFWNAALSQLDAITLEHLKDASHRYSRIRLWGSIGFIVAVQGVGLLLDWYPISQLPIWISLCLLALWLVSVITPEAPKTLQAVTGLAMRHIIKRPEVIAFFVMSLLLQMAYAPFYVFYSVYLKTLHYSSTMIGLLWALGVIAEIVLFIFMAPVLARFSQRHILLFGIASGIVRWLLIAYQADTWPLLVLAQLIHASSFGAVHIVSVMMIQRFFGTRHASKGQALYNSLSFGLGGMIGSTLSGDYWDSHGATMIYGAGALACVFALLIAYLWVGRSEPSITAVKRPQTFKKSKSKRRYKKR